MKKIYLKPIMQIVQMQHLCHLLAGSDISSIITNLDEDNIEIEPDEDVGNAFWAR